MKKKVYITIDIPEAVKLGFRKEESRWKNLKVFWLGAQSLRVNFIFLGILDRKELQIATEAVQETAEITPEWEWTLDKLTLGPDFNEPTMFWVTLKDIPAAANFKKKLIEKLKEKNFPLSAKTENFTPHIVLAAARGNQLKGKKTFVPLNGKIPVQTLNLMLTQTYERGKVKHKLWETFKLKPQL